MYLPPWEVFHSFRIQESFVTLNTTDLTLVVAQNPRRIGIWFSKDVGGDDIAVTPKSGGKGIQGLKITNEVMNIGLSHAQWGALVGMEWWGYSYVGASNCIVTEVILDSDPCEKQV